MKIKRLTKKVSALCLLTTLGLGYSITVFAVEPTASSRVSTSLKENSLLFGVDSYWSSYWETFKWKDNDDGSISLAPTEDGQFILPSDLSSSLGLSTVYKIMVRDINGGVKYQKTFKEGSRLRDFATAMSLVKLTKGNDSIQVTFFSNIINYSVLGPIKANSSGASFSEPTKDTLANYALVPREDGMYPLYLNQNKIEDGNYVINASFSQDQFLTYEENNNVLVNSHTQDWNFKYNTDRRAYQLYPIDKINKVMSWSEKKGNNVSIYENFSYNDQFWYLKKTQDNQYNVISASNTSRYLNVDVNRNVSLAEKRDNEFQKFTLTKAN